MDCADIEQIRKHHYLEQFKSLVRDGLGEQGARYSSIPVCHLGQTLVECTDHTATGDYPVRAGK